MSDADLIDQLGGPAKVCELLRIPKAGGVQRVQNWKVRGIPARVKLERPDLFLHAHGSVQQGGAPVAAAAPQVANAA
jgi:hypothetical protein